VRIEEIGATRVWLKGDGSAFLFHPDCFPGILGAWDAATERLFCGRDLYGDALAVKIADIVAVSRATPEAIAAGKADEDEQAQRAALE